MSISPKVPRAAARDRVWEPKGTYTTLHTMATELSHEHRTAFGVLESEKPLVPTLELVCKGATVVVTHPPQNPAGPFVDEPTGTPARQRELIARIAEAPRRLRSLVTDLSPAQLDVRYRDWTMRQIIHHMADSHVNSYIRFKWALTEDLPTIKAYYEDRWAALPDSRTGDIQLPLALLEALHARWVLLLNEMKEADFSRAFVHPQSGATVTLHSALSYYAWHGEHHTSQVAWILENRPIK